MSVPRPQQTMRVGRSIAQDWLKVLVYFRSPSHLWSPRVSQLVMTPSTSPTCLGTPPLYIQTVSASLSRWPRLLKLEGECWREMEIWQLVPVWSRDVGVAWSSRGTSSKPIRLIRFTAHPRHDARSGSEYDDGLNAQSWFSLSLTQWMVRLIYNTKSCLQGLCLKSVVCKAQLHNNVCVCLTICKHNKIFLLK